MNKLTEILKISLLVAGVVLASYPVYAGSDGVWETTKEVGSDVWDGTKEVTSDVWDGTKKVTGDVWDGTKKVGSDVKNAVTDDKPASEPMPSKTTTSD